MTAIAIALTFGSGAMDVASFTRLGSVFASVMTGNIVLCGLAAARGSISLVTHTVVAFLGYVAGVFAGTRIAWYRSTAPGEDGGDTENGGTLAPHVTASLLAELALLAGLVVGWELTGSNPGGLVQFTLLAVAAAAMGIQASAVQQMGLTEVSTTYLTGTLTGLVGSLANPARSKREGLIRPGVLLGLAAGALLSGMLLAVAPAGVPALPVAALCLVIYLGARRPRPA
jgi:uncharacterized membrane protein YoaK (UPF0700 family)